MANYKFTVTVTTNYDKEEFSTNDFDSACAMFTAYKEKVEDCELSEYEIVVMDNRTGEIYEHLSHFFRRISVEELKALDTVFPEESPQSLGKTFADCVNENIPDELIDEVWRIIEGE